MSSYTIGAVVFVLFIIICAVFHWEKVVAKIMLSGGVLLLAATAIVFAASSDKLIPVGPTFTSDELASRLATYAYFALVFGVLLLLIERIRIRRKKNRN